MLVSESHLIYHHLYLTHKQSWYLVVYIYTWMQVHCEALGLADADLLVCITLGGLVRSV
jgi:hypothetical protein